MVALAVIRLAAARVVDDRSDDAARRSGLSLNGIQGTPGAVEGLHARPSAERTSRDRPIQQVGLVFRDASAKREALVRRRWPSRRSARKRCALIKTA